MYPRLVLVTIVLCALLLCSIPPNSVGLASAADTFDTNCRTAYSARQCDCYKRELKKVMERFKKATDKAWKGNDRSQNKADKFADAGMEMFHGTDQAAKKCRLN